MFSNVVRLYAWDKGLDFEVVSRRFVEVIEELKKRFYRGDASVLRRLAYMVVLFTQLRNGCRVSEALEAVIQWGVTGLREVKIRARKSNVERLVVIPREISDLRFIAEKLKEEVDEKGFDKVLACVKNFCRRRLGFNTHALRYAFITYMSKIGLSPQEIAKLTGHKKLDYILHYFEKVKAEDVLRKINL